MQANRFRLENNNSLDLENEINQLSSELESIGRRIQEEYEDFVNYKDRNEQILIQKDNTLLKSHKVKF
jgi:hypothetical protein